MATNGETIALPEYNGWTNYPTWNAFLWLSNDEDTFNAFLAFGQRNPSERDVRDYIYRYVTSTWGSSSPREDMTNWARHYDRPFTWALDRIDYESIRAHLAEAIRDAL